MSLKKIPEFFPLDWRFGTDGIRGPVQSKMNPLFMVKLGWAAGKIFKQKGIEGILIGKDTRISGYMIESALESGFISAGVNVTLVGPMPTPGIAYLAKSTHQAGLVISASHNRFSDNGIKFLKEHIDIFESAEKDYGVSKFYIASIIGMETNYGTYYGSYNPLDTIFTRAFEPSSNFWQKELIQLFILSKRYNNCP